MENKEKKIRERGQCRKILTEKTYDAPRPLNTELDAERAGCQSTETRRHDPKRDESANKEDKYARGP